MLQSLSSMDQYLLHKINGTWYHPKLDVFFRFVSNFRFYLAIPVLAILIFGGNRWRYALLLAVLAVGAADLASNGVKEVVHRPRAYETENIRPAAGYRYTAKGSGFPSNHSASTLAGMLILAWHARRKKWVAALCLLPALLVGYSRIYLGVHYPSDVLGGFLVGGTMASTILALHACVPVISFETDSARKFSWRGLTYLFFFIALAYRYSVVSRADLPLFPEEIQSWDWSRKLDWYYSTQPPLTALLLRFSTSVFGATQFAVRSVAVTMSVGMLLFGGLLAQRIFNSERTTFFVLLGLFFVPMFLVNALLLTSGAPLMCFWAGCCYFLYSALIEEQERAWWPAGGCVALGVLSHYAMLYIFICIAFYYLIHADSRRSLHTKGPYIFTLFTVLSVVPITVWNMRHQWIGFEHVMAQAKVQDGFKIDLRSMARYVGEQAGVASPALVVVWICAAYSILFRQRGSTPAHDKFLLAMGLPVYLILLLKSVHGPVLVDWAMPAYFSLTILAVTRVERIFQSAATGGRVAGAALGVACIAPSLLVFPVLHEPTSYDRMVKTLEHWRIKMPARWNLAFQVVGFDEMGKWVSKSLSEMPSPEKTLLISRQYQEAAEMAFYVEGHPQIYSITIGKNSADPYGVWPTLDISKKGCDAIYVAQGRMKALDPEIAASFQSVSPPQYLAIMRNGKEVRQFTLFKCAVFSGEFDTTTR